MNPLFVCNQGENRSLTAMEMYAKKGIKLKLLGYIAILRAITETGRQGYWTGLTLNMRLETSIERSMNRECRE